MRTRNIFLYGAAILVLSGIQAQTDQTPCPQPVNVGDDPALPVQPQNNANHGASTTTVLFDPLYTVQCCGVITKYELQVHAGPDGCPSTGCQMNFLVFDQIDLTTRKARLTGANLDFTIVRPTSGYLTVDIPVDQQLPVKQGDVIGFDGLINGVEYFDDDVVSPNTCIANAYICNQNYMKTSANERIQSRNAGQVYEFQEIGAIDQPTITRFYAFRAIVERGALPAFTNLPHTVTIASTTPVGTSVFKVTASDANAMDRLSMTLVRQCPIAQYFNLATNGDVTVAKALDHAPYLTHTLTLEVTDQCSTTTQTLDIIVQGPTDATTASSHGSIDSHGSSSGTNGGGNTIIATNQGLLDTRDGQILVGLLAAALAFSIATAVGICCLCYQLRSGLYGGGGRGGHSNQSPQYYEQPYQDPYQTNQQPSSNAYQNSQPTQPEPKSQNRYPNEPRPSSYKPDDIRNHNKVKPYDEQTPRDVHVRTVSPSQNYKDQLFW